MAAPEPRVHPRCCTWATTFKTKAKSHVLAAAADAEGATLVVAPHDHIGRAVAPRVAVRMGAGMVPGVTGLLKVQK